MANPDSGGTEGYSDTHAQKINIEAAAILSARHRLQAHTVSSELKQHAVACPMSGRTSTSCLCLQQQGLGPSERHAQQMGAAIHVQSGLEKIRTDGGPPCHGAGMLLRALSLEARSKEHMLFAGI